MSIQQLPEDVIAQIKSSITITSLNGVICGLMKNSLDAGATRISISFNYAQGYCSIEDNGNGITPAEFSPSGGLGKLYYTSRYPRRPDVHGRCGTFLASVAALSLLSVTSHYREYYSHNTIKIRNSEILARHMPSLPDQRIVSFSHGTRVTVRDLFGSMPVRVKQRAAVDRIKELHHLKYDITALCLSWPSHVSISTYESSLPQTMIRGYHDKSCRTGLVARTYRTLTQAGLSEESSLESWVAVRASACRIDINGAVCLVPVATRRIQFISLGIQPVSNERGSNVLYEEINRLFSDSSFGVEEAVSDLDDSEKSRRAEDRRYKTDGYTNRELRGKKGIDRWPMFYINICLDESGGPSLNHDVDEVLDERQQTLQAIIDVLRAMVYEFLKKYHFRPKKIASLKNNSSSRSTSRDSGRKSTSRGNTPKAETKPSSLSYVRSVSNHTSRTASPVGDLASTRLRLPRSNQSRLSSESPFDNWSRIKSGRIIPETTKSFDVTENPPIPLFDSSGTILHAPFSDVEELSALDNPELDQNVVGSIEADGNDDIIWINPVTKKKSIIDSKTGFVRTPSSTTDGGSSNLVRASRLDSGKRLRLQPRAEESKETSPWLRDLLSSWKNPVFEAVEPSIPTAFDTARFATTNMITSAGHCHGRLSTGRDSSNTHSSVEGRVSKDALRQAEVIAQVDRKFILAKLRLMTASKQASGCEKEASLLVVIDQHAADERHGVEILMMEYFKLDTSASPHKMKVQTEVLGRPLQFEVAIQERSLFERYASHFECWGIAYEIHRPHSTDLKNGRSPSFLKVHHLPPSIAERCRQEPRLLIELLRKEIWKLDDHGQGGTITDTASPNVNTDERNWPSRFHGCPQGILDMINSRACRSAIMFNDVLSIDECRELLARLADCAFPFQCAHGRPSMVPLVDLGAATSPMMGIEEVDCGCFGREFNRWKRSMK